MDRWRDLVVVAVLVLAAGACTGDGEPDRADPGTTTSAAPRSTTTSVPEDAVWALDSDRLEVERVEEEDGEPEPLEGGRPGVAYRRDDGVTARIVHVTDRVGPTGTAPSEVDPLGEGAATVFVPLGEEGADGAAVLTVSGAPTTAAAVEAARTLADLVGEGPVDAEPAERLGDFRLLGRTDGASPVVTAPRIVLRYEVDGFGDLLLTQEELIDPDLPLDLAVVPALEPVEVDDGHPIVLQEGGTGVPPSLVTIRGTSRVTLWSPAVPADDLRLLARTLHPLDRAGFAALVAEAEADVAPIGEAEPLVDGVSLYARGDDEPVACIDGRRPHRCAEAVSVTPLIVPIREGGGYLVVGCVHRPADVAEVRVDGQRVPTVTAPCGRAFSAVADLGLVTVQVPDAEGNLAGYHYELEP